MGQSTAYMASVICSSQTYSLAKTNKTGKAKGQLYTNQFTHVSNFNASITLPYNVYCPASREFQYSCGRESSIWQVTSAAKAGCAGIRTTNLAQPKLAPEGYTQQHYSSAMSCGRVSPIWRPSKSALSCSSRPRTEQLARPKSTHSFYQPPKEVSDLQFFVHIILI